MQPTGSSPVDLGASSTPETLLVALMRMIRLIKRDHDLPIEPALQYVLHIVNCSGPMRLSDLAGQLQLDLSTVSRHVRALEGSGYMERAIDPDDKRASLLSVTDEGRTVLEEAFARRRARLDAVLSGWSEQDLHTLDRLLNRLSQDIDTELSKPAGA